MRVISPELFTKRSLTYQLHNALQYEERCGAGVIQQYATTDSVKQLHACALLDLSELSRTGLRGKNTETVLTQGNLPFPVRPNQINMLANGAVVARLGSTECWILDNPLLTTTCIDQLDARVTSAADCYPVYCQHTHAWFALSGQYMPVLMAKVCGVDLRQDVFPIGSVVQTSLARVSAVIIHHRIGQTPVFSILSDSSLAEYLWYALLDAMQEFQGKAVGLGVFSNR